MVRSSAERPCGQRDPEGQGFLVGCQRIGTRARQIGDSRQTREDLRRLAGEAGVAAMAREVVSILLTHQRTSNSFISSGRSVSRRSANLMMYS